MPVAVGAFGVRIVEELRAGGVVELDLHGIECELGSERIGRSRVQLIHRERDDGDSSL